MAGSPNYPVALAVDELGEDFVLTAQVQAPMNRCECATCAQALERLVEALERAPQTPICRIECYLKPNVIKF